MQGEPLKYLCATSIEVLAPSQIMTIHQENGHPSMRWILHIVSKSTVRTMVKNCKAYRSIDPSSVQWRCGQLGVSDTWSRVGMDLTHYRDKQFLTLIDCDLHPIWSLLTNGSTRLPKCHSSYFFSKVQQRRFSETTIPLSVVGNQAFLTQVESLPLAALCIWAIKEWHSREMPLEDYNQEAMCFNESSILIQCDVKEWLFKHNAFYMYQVWINHALIWSWGDTLTIQCLRSHVGEASK